MRLISSTAKSLKRRNVRLRRRGSVKESRKSRKRLLERQTLTSWLIRRDSARRSSKRRGRLRSTPARRTLSISSRRTVKI